MMGITRTWVGWLEPRPQVAAGSSKLEARYSLIATCCTPGKPRTANDEQQMLPYN